MPRRVPTFVRVRRFGRRKVKARLNWRVVMAFAAIVGIGALIALKYNERELHSQPPALRGHIRSEPIE